MDFILQYLPVTLQVLGAVIALLVVVSPLTRSNLDNRLLDVLRKLANVLSRLVGSPTLKA